MELPEIEIPEVEPGVGVEDGVPADVSRGRPLLR